MKMKALYTSLIGAILTVIPMVSAEDVSASATLLGNPTFVTLAVTLGAVVMSGGLILTFLKLMSDLETGADINPKEIIGYIIFLLVGITMIGTYVATLFA